MKQFFSGILLNLTLGRFLSEFLGDSFILLNFHPGLHPAAVPRVAQVPVARPRRGGPDRARAQVAEGRGRRPRGVGRDEGGARGHEGRPAGDAARHADHLVAPPAARHSRNDDARAAGRQFNSIEKI